MKRWSLETYHGFRSQHVDVYLNEFVFRFNRRRHRPASFETLLGLVAERGPATYRDITGAPNRPRKNPAMRRQPQRRCTVFGLRAGRGGRQSRVLAPPERQ